MKQETVTILGSKISYLDNGSGDLGTILFIHGNSFSSQTFTAQFDSPLFKNYRLLALDLYGHGESEQLVNPFGYHLPQYAKLVVEFIKELHLANVVLAGHSLGGHIALEILGSHVEGLVSGVFTWGTPPLSNPIKEIHAFLPNPAAPLLYKSVLHSEEAIEFVTQCFGTWSEDLRPYADIVLKTSSEARPSLGASVGQLNFADEVKAITKAKFPVAIMYAHEDKLINPDHFLSIQNENLWEGKCHSLPGSHFCHLDHPEEFNQSLLSYTQSIENLFFSDDRKVIIKDHVSVSV